MSTQAAQQMGLQVVVLDSDPHCPASQVTPLQVLKDWNSPDGTVELAEQCAVLTLENEWAAPKNLELARRAGASVLPSPETLTIIGDKLQQRRVFASCGLPSPGFSTLESWGDLNSCLAKWSGRAVIKSRHGGYDGYGVKIVTHDTSSSELPSQPASEWYAEEFVPFDRELAVMVSKNAAGDVSVYPVVESRQTSDGHRCDIVIAPAPELPDALVSSARSIAAKAVDAVNGVGLFGVELFASGSEFIVNEIAPRPHNSGHYTMDGCRTSQFEQHIRTIRNLPPGPVDLLAPVVVMANLLAPQDGSIDIERAHAYAYAAVPEIHVHWYGKTSMRDGRKMGHINVLGDTLETTLGRALLAREQFWKGIL